MLGLKLNHVSKRGHRWHSTHCVPEANSDSNAVWFVCNCKGKDMCLNCPCNNVVFLYIDICSCLGCTAFCRDVFAFTSFVCTRKVAKHIVHTNMCRSVPQLTYQIYDNLGYSVILLSDSLTFAVHPRYSVYIVWMPSIKGIHRIFSLGICFNSAFLTGYEHKHRRRSTNNNCLGCHVVLDTLISGQGKTIIRNDPKNFWVMVITNSGD